MQQFKKFGISEKNIYFARKELFNILKHEDTIVFKNIDDLGKNFEEMKSNFDYLVVYGVILQFLEQPILNTLGKNEDTLKIISFLLQYFIEKQPLKKEKKIRGRKSAYKNLSKRQKEILGDFYMKKISFKEVMILTGFCRSYLYVLKRKFKVKKIQ